MNAVRIFPSNVSQQFLNWFVRKGSVVYVSLPLRGASLEPVLIRGSVLSVKRNGFGARVVRVLIHARCRLYKEASLPNDSIVEMDFSMIVGADYAGTLVL